MRFLVDTHALIWFLFDDPRLSKRARKLIMKADSSVSLSIASLWEIGIKVSIGKLKLGIEYKEFLDEFILGRDFDLQPIKLDALVQSVGLPWHHRDPFDRLLIAQAQTLKIPIVSNDRRFDQYDIELLW